MEPRDVASDVRYSKIQRHESQKSFSRIANGMRKRFSAGRQRPILRRHSSQRHSRETQDFPHGPGIRRQSPETTGDVGGRQNYARRRRQTRNRESLASSKVGGSLTN